MHEDPFAAHDASPGRPLDRTLLLVLVLGTLASLPLTVHGYWDARPDAARYLLAARSLADGNGYTVMGEPFRLRPPGFSLLLAPLVAWRGFDFAVLNALVSLFGVAAVALLYLLVLPRTGAPVAFGVAVLAWLNPQLQALCNQVMSDVPALVLALLVLLLLRRANARPSPGREAVLVLTLAAAAYVRSANVLLVPAIVLDRACRQVFGSGPREATGRFLLRRIVVPLAAFTLLYLPWMLTPSYTSRYDSPDLHSYATAFLRADPNDPGAPALVASAWQERVVQNASAYAAMLATGMATRRASRVAPLVAGLAIAGLLCVLARRREAPEWFALGTAVVIVGYYVAATRLLLPVYVLAAGALAETVAWLLARVVAPRTAALVVTVVLLAVGVAQRAVDPRPEARAGWDSLVAATQHVREAAPDAAAIGGDVGAVYALMLDRPVYSLRPLSRRGQEAELLRLLDERGIRVLLAERPGPLDPVVERLRADGAEVVTLPRHVVVHRTPRNPAP